MATGSIRLAEEGPWVLDTDVIIAWLRRVPSIVARLRGYSPADLAITTMSEAELRYGALLSRDPAGNLEQVESVLDSGVAILPFDREAAGHHALLREGLRHSPIGERDLVIASVARANGFGVATGNVREFGRVPGLRVEPWLPGLPAPAPRCDIHHPFRVSDS